MLHRVMEVFTTQDQRDRKLIFVSIVYSLEKNEPIIAPKGQRSKNRLMN